MLVPLLLIAAVSLMVVGLVGNAAGGRRGCGQAVAVAAMAARLRSTASETAASGSSGCLSRAQPAAGKR